MVLGTLLGNPCLGTLLVGTLLWEPCLGDQLGSSLRKHTWERCFGKEPVSENFGWERCVGTLRLGTLCNLGTLFGNLGGDLSYG